MPVMEYCTGVCGCLKIRTAPDIDADKVHFCSGRIVCLYSNFNYFLSWSLWTMVKPIGGWMDRWMARIINPIISLVLLRYVCVGVCLCPSYISCRYGSSFEVIDQDRTESEWRIYANFRIKSILPGRNFHLQHTHAYAHPGASTHTYASPISSMPVCFYVCSSLLWFNGSQGKKWMKHGLLFAKWWCGWFVGWMDG